MFVQFLWALSAFFLAVQANGDFVVLHSPDSVTFKADQNQGVDQSLLKEVFTAALGFTVKQQVTWNIITVNNPFTLPEAVVGIAVEGVESLGTTKGQKFRLNVDEVEETTWQALSGRLEERDTDNSLVRIYLGDGLDALGHSALGELKPAPINPSSLKALSLDVDEDRKFVEEVQLLHAIANKVQSTGNMDAGTDVYWLVVSGLKPVLDLHGKDSEAATEAYMLLNDALNDISKAFTDVYKDKVLITAFTNDASHVRNTRSTVSDYHVRQRREAVFDNGTGENLETSTLGGVTRFDDENYDKDVPPPQADSWNVAKNYSDNYPVIFNIILWFGVVFFFSLLAVCFVIAEMDPGRDSIIYRMTSNRMKKDN